MYTLPFVGSVLWTLQPTGYQTVQQRNVVLKTTFILNYILGRLSSTSDVPTLLTLSVSSQ